MLGDKDPAVRQQAVAGLVRLKHRALPTLSVVLEGKEKTAVLCALKVVNQLGPTASPVASIISRQVMHADAEVRIEAVRSLVRIGPDGRSALRNGMFSPHVDVRKLVVQLIAKRATEEVELLAATLDDSDAEVRRLAIAGLVSAGQTALPELLQRIQLLDRRPGTYAATRAIHELEKRLLPPHEKQLGDLMLLLLQQGPVAARQVALELALALDRRTEARKILRQVSKNPRDPRAQVWARKRLGD